MSHPDNAERPELGGSDIIDSLDYGLLNDRTVILNSDVDEWLAGKLTRMFTRLAKIKASVDPELYTVDTDIRLLISSHGGEIDAGNSIIRAIEDARDNGCAVHGEVRGYAMSMAATILQHCDTRTISKNDIIMVHGATSVNIGDIRNQEEDLKLTVRIMQDWAKFYAERNTSEEEKFHDKAFWLKMLRDNTPHYFIGEEALTAGLVDEVLE